MFSWWLNEAQHSPRAVLSFVLLKQSSNMQKLRNCEVNCVKRRRCSRKKPRWAPLLITVSWKFDLESFRLLDYLVFVFPPLFAWFIRFTRTRRRPHRQESFKLHWIDPNRTFSSPLCCRPVHLVHLIFCFFGVAVNKQTDRRSCLQNPLLRKARRSHLRQSVNDSSEDKLQWGVLLKFHFKRLMIERRALFGAKSLRLICSVRQLRETKPVCVLCNAYGNHRSSVPLRVTWKEDFQVGLHIGKKKGKVSVMQQLHGTSDAFCSTHRQRIVRRWISAVDF